MPNVSTYVRTEDFDKYRSIKDKGEWSDFIHTALNPIRLVNAHPFNPPVKLLKTPKLPKNPIPVTDNPLLENARDKINNDQIDKVKSHKQEIIEGLKRLPGISEISTCKNGHLAVDGRCNQKDCKYS